MGGVTVIKKLKQTTQYFTTQEAEANQIIAEIQEKSDGIILKKQIDRKGHKDYGDYFETTIVEEFTNSRSILENGY